MEFFIVLSSPCYSVVIFPNNFLYYSEGKISWKGILVLTCQGLFHISLLQKSQSHLGWDWAKHESWCSPVASEQFHHWCSLSRRTTDTKQNKYRKLELHFMQYCTKFNILTITVQLLSSSSWFCNHRVRFSIVHLFKIRKLGKRRTLWYFNLY